jgi:endonuclease/exonuclease/phosphatase (EEP) superfamily protein YafD
MPTSASLSLRRAALAASLAFLIACTPGASSRAQLSPSDRTAPATVDAELRVLAWNVAETSFVRDVKSFRAHLVRARADILLFDEVLPSAAGAPLAEALAPLPSAHAGQWQFVIGESGGRQRGVIASRMPLERLPELAGPVPYPTADRERLQARMVAANGAQPIYTMDGGIPVSGAIVQTGARRVLVVVVDLQCCGDAPDSWQEERRLVETREIRRRIGQVLARTRVEGVIVAGDLNLVNTPLPLLTLAGPYAAPHHGLLAATLTHLDGKETWTWDGRGTPFPSRPMDFLLYDPRALELREGYVLDSADLDAAELARLDLHPDASSRLSDHRPLVTAFTWRAQR